MTSNTPNTCERYTKKAASVSETEAAFLRKMEKKIARKKNQAMSVSSSRVGSLDGSKPETMYTTRRAADTA